MDEYRLGTLFLENPLMREEDLERCLEIQRLTGGMRPLGEILVEEGVIDAAALERLLTVQAVRRLATQQAPVCREEVVEPATLLEVAIATGADELLLSERRPPFVRIAGRLQPLAAEPLDAAQITEFIALHFPELGAPRTDAPGVRRGDFRLDGVVRGKVIAAAHAEGVAVVVRLHPDQPRTLQQLGLRDDLRESLEAQQGLILVVGERCSGITETLGAMLVELAAAEDRMVLVLDEDLEFPETTGPAVVVRRRVGDHTRSYAAGLAAAISQHADVIVVGDASSPEVFDLCLGAAESGRLVVAAMPGRRAAEALERAVSFVAPAEVTRRRVTLASVLRCVVAVQLLPAADELGQVLASEVLRIGDAARVVIREGALPQLDLLMRLDAANGSGHSMDSCLLGLLSRRKILFSDALRRAENKKQLLGAPRADGGE